MELNEYEIKHLKELEKVTSECTLFLKRDNDDFPLDINSVKDIALYGNGIRHILKGGTGSGVVNVHRFNTVEEVFESHNIKVTTKEWLDSYDSFTISRHKGFIKRVKKDAKTNRVFAGVYSMGQILEEGEYDFPLNDNSKIAIYVLSRNEGEGADRKDAKGDYRLTDSEIRDIKALSNSHEKFLLVLNTGYQIDITPVLEVKNILLLSQLGSLTSETLFDIIFGNKYPSGKLSDSWGEITLLPHYKEFGDRDETNYVEDIYVGYRYYDTFDVKPTFEFGYGLGYTEFEISLVEVANKKDTISVKGKVKNIGKHLGKEVVQLYLRKSTAKFDNPAQILVNFYKTKELKPQEEESFEISFKLSDFASFDSSKDAYILTGDIYQVAMGNSSRNNEVIVSISISEDILVKKVKHIDDNLGFEALKCPKKYELEKFSNHIELTKKDFYYEETKYKRYKVDYPNIVNSLSIEQLARLSLGDIKTGVDGFIGESCSKAVGGAGETCLTTPGFNSYLSMCDGPAGVRLCKDYVISKGKTYKISTDPIMELICQFLPKFLRGLLDGSKNAKRKGEVKHQYCTAIPIGTALAQSFSKEVIVICGDVVREEMDLFNVDLWLAPALNIHRHPLCGRNFEYYSEDPFLSGFCASEMTKAIQKNGNRGVTLKHFACNNQETNRMNNSSNLSIRALREIYLPGFEKVVKETNPAAFMVSYNLINHIHTSESTFLINDVLRCEWGYEGLVMSDWIKTGQVYNAGSLNPSATASGNLLGGTNLTMPGGSSDFKDILKAYKKGRISIDDLKNNASIVISAIKKIKKNSVE